MPHTLGVGTGSAPELGDLASAGDHAGCSAEAPSGIDPVASSSRRVEAILATWIERQAAAAVSLYRARFEIGARVTRSGVS